MEEIVKTLQDLQLEAIKKGVSSFHLTTVLGDDGKYFASAYVRLRDDDTDGDHLSETFYPDTFGPEYKIERLRAFINSLN